MSSARLGERVIAPFGRRRAEVIANRRSGGYGIVTVADPVGPAPAPGQFYMLSSASRWSYSDERPFLSRAFSVAAVRDVGGPELDFLLEAVGPGTARLGDLERGEDVWLVGPLGKPFSRPSELNRNAAGAVLVGGGIGIAPIAILRSALAASGIASRVLLGFRDRQHSGGVQELFGCEEVRLASEDGHAGHKGYVTDLLGVILEGDSAKTAAVYACGPPGMLEAVRAMCESAGVQCELAMEAPMACGFGACYGCAVPVAGGGYIRLCVDGPVIRGEEIETALIAGSGHR